jgi:hypothetical protein
MNEVEQTSSIHFSTCLACILAYNSRGVMIGVRQLCAYDIEHKLGSHHTADEWNAFQHINNIQ